MIGHDKRLGLVVLAGCVVGMISGAANAADFAQRSRAEALAREQGFAKPELALLKRIPGPGRDQASKTLMKRFAGSRATISTAGKSSIEQSKDSIANIGDGWFLQVYADGSKVRYRNYGYLDSDKNKWIPVAKRPAQDRLEALGREFINKQLNGLVKLGRGEQLVPHFTEFQIGGGGSTKEGAKPDPEYLAASTVVFTRSVNGVPVIGPGSKIAVIFANDGSPVGFDYDWPAYQPLRKSQKLEPLGTIRERAKKLGALDAQRADTVEKRFECGYFDMGARRRDREAAVQAGCAIHAVQRKVVDREVHAKDPRSGHIMIARVDVIPAGVEVEPDSNWPQAATLLGKPAAKPRPPADGPKPGAIKPSLTAPVLKTVPSAPSVVRPAP